MSKSALVITAMLLFAATLHGQILRVASMKLDPYDATAATHEVLDANGDPCALLRIRLVDKEVHFECDWIVRTENRGGNEYWVWLCSGTRNITVKSNGALPLEVAFADHNPDIAGLKAKHTYVLTLEKMQAQATVNVRFRCSVDDAQVKVDGYAVPLKKKVPMAPGRHHVTASAPHFEPYSDTITISPYFTSDQTFEVVMESALLRDQYEAGMVHYEAKRYKEAAEQWQQAVEGGYVPAQGWLGRLYLWGWGVEKDYAKAFRYLLPAAKAGDANAQWRVGMLYEFGEGVTKDHYAAREWYTKSAEQGNAEGQYHLGLLLEGVKDYAEAAKWMRRAADQQNVKAQTMLGVFYSEGKGVPQDYGQAVKWTRLAADKGNATAQYNMGWLYYNGKGVAQSTAEAKKWFEKADAQGYASARKMLDKINADAKPAAPKNTAPVSKNTATQSGTINPDKIYTKVDEMPVFKYRGRQGWDAIREFSDENFRCPKISREEGSFMGSVFVMFVVEKDGSISNVEVLSDKVSRQRWAGYCRQEAVRLVKSMPKWVCGKQNGTPVRVRCQADISFSCMSTE